MISTISVESSSIYDVPTKYFKNKLPHFLVQHSLEHKI
jgi:hypothetical protein